MVSQLRRVCSGTESSLGRVAGGLCWDMDGDIEGGGAGDFGGTLPFGVSVQPLPP